MGDTPEPRFPGGPERSVTHFPQRNRSQLGWPHSGIIRKKLQLRTQKSHGVFVIPVSEKPKLERLYERYGENRDQVGEEQAAQADAAGEGTSAGPPVDSEAGVSAARVVQSFAKREDPNGGPEGASRSSGTDP